MPNKYCTYHELMELRRLRSEVPLNWRVVACLSFSFPTIIALSLLIRSM